MFSKPNNESSLELAVLRVSNLMSLRDSSKSRTASFTVHRLCPVWNTVIVVAIVYVSVVLLVCQSVRAGGIMVRGFICLSSLETQA